MSEEKDQPLIEAVEEKLADDGRRMLHGSKPEDVVKKADGQYSDHAILSDEERARGFIRPVRNAYVHVGIRPKYPLRDLTPDEIERFKDDGYVKYEEYPKSERPHLGRYWTQRDLTSGCNSRTTMPQKIAETYAAKPGFYGSTFCCTCGDYFPVGASGEFVWEGTEEKVGT